MLPDFINYKVYNKTYNGKKKILIPTNFFNLYKCLKYLKKLNIKQINIFFFIELIFEKTQI